MIVHNQTETQEGIAPLYSWDIFMEGYQRMMGLAGDKAALEKFALTKKWATMFDFGDQLFRLGKTVLITSPQQKIVFASSNIYQMNGYKAEDVIGQFPVIFQGVDTSASTKQEIRNAIKHQQPFNTSILNYRKNGEAYLCHIEGHPIFNRQQQLLNFIAFEIAA